MINSSFHLIIDLSKYQKVLSQIFTSIVVFRELRIDMSLTSFMF